MYRITICGQCEQEFEYVQVTGKRNICDACKKKNRKEVLHSEAYKIYKKEYDKEYCNKNKARIKAYYKEYHKDYHQRPEVKERINTRYKRKRKNDPQHRLRMNVSTAIWKALKGGKNGQSWELLVGFTLTDLKKHLQKQFTDGMSWDNYGDWHLDHIVPVSAFNYTSPTHEDFKECWALKNLQPMWASENKSKNAKLYKHFQPSLVISAMANYV